MFLPLAPSPEYSITAKIKLVAPYRVTDMNDEFQSARLLSESNGVATFQIRYRPLHQQQISSDPNWRKNDAGMIEYLKPRPAANWDRKLRETILTELKSSGIDPDILDDRSLVQQISSWALRRSSFNEQFGLWMIDFTKGKPEVARGLEKSFADNEPPGKSFDWICDHEVYGKEMFLNKTHAACTSSSTYLATVLRAVGIPTRIVVTVPLFDNNDPGQRALVRKSLKNHLASHTIIVGNTGDGFSNHLFNEVWVGGKWVRLNYDKLGQGILDRNYEGLMTHILTVKDISEIPFPETWGRRYGLKEGPKLSSENPYQLLSLSDFLPAEMANPMPASLTSSTVTAIIPAGDPRLPEAFRSIKDVDAFLSVKEWLRDENYYQMTEFLGDASTRFTLKSLGHPDIVVHLTAWKISTGDGNFQAYGVKFERTPDLGFEYRLVPLNERHHHLWEVAGATWKSAARA